MTSSMLPAMSAVIPTYREVGVPLTFACVRSMLLAHEHLGNEAIEIVVVEDSDDPGVEVLLHEALDPLKANLRIVTQPNGGFAKACNRGIQMCNGQLVTLVNNDVEFVEPTLQILTDMSINVRAGVVGCRLLYPDFTVQHGGVVYVPIEDEEKREQAGIPGYFDHIGRRAIANHPGVLTIRPSLVTGAVFGITRWAINTIGLLDERFGFAAEDVDYCMLCTNSGRQPYYCGYTYAIHKEGATRGVTPEEKMRLAPEVAVKESDSLKFLFKKWAGVDWASATGRIAQ